VSRFHWLRVPSFLALASLVGCASHINYDSTFDRNELRQLQGKTLLLLRSDANALVEGESLDQGMAQKVAESDRATFLGAFGSLFRVHDVSAPAKGQPNSRIGGRPTLVRNLEQRFGAAGIFVVTNSYAYEMDGPTLQDPAQIRSYNFASDTILYGRDGRVVWRFYGKASALPQMLQMLSPRNLLRSAVGLPPTSKTIAENMMDIARVYNRYLAWMMRRDLKGDGKTYFTDYPVDPREQVSVFPADDESYVPYVKGYDPLSNLHPATPHV
jgi:hypothetical protein